MKILFWGPLTLQWFHFDLKNAKLAKNNFRHARALTQPQKSALAHKRGKKKRRIWRRFQKYKLVLATKCL
jgi:hypothetical protein